LRDQGFRKPDHVTFADFADRFVHEYLPGRKLKPSTIENYRYMLDGQDSRRRRSRTSSYS
jgi:hypothetical protein